jgi:hypothetical protein
MPFEKSPERAKTLRQSLTTRKRQVNYLLGSRAYVVRTRRLHVRIRVFVSTNQRHGHSDINIFVDDAPLKKARTSWLFCSRHPSK